jgi:hypothetical protein
MKRLALSVGLLVAALGAAIPARADYSDYGVVRFQSGFCRVWPDTAMVPFGGQFFGISSSLGRASLVAVSFPHVGGCSHSFAGSLIAPSLFRYRPQRVAVAKGPVFL